MPGRDRTLPENHNPPKFIVLLGDRYGWCPLPSEIPQDEFEQIIKKVTDQGEKDKINQWYRFDINAVPPVYCLKERVVKIAEGANDDQEIVAKEKESQDWKQTEKNLRLILIKAFDQLGLQKDDPRRVKYVASAAEQAFEEARRWKSYDGIPLRSNGKQGLRKDVSGIIRDMFSRLTCARWTNFLGSGCRRTAMGRVGTSAHRPVFPRSQS